MRSPVLFMIFRRPEATAEVFKAIREARPPRLYIAADGPRPDRPEDMELCNLAREAATAVDWECEVKTLFRGRSLSRAVACSGALNWFFQHEQEGIVLEDDVLPHQDFFHFCDQMLEYYRDEPKVFQITANNFQMGLKRGGASYYFSRLSHTWGWATWARAWKHYDHSMAGLPAFLKNDLPALFPSEEAVRYFSRTLRAVKEDIVPSWAFRWLFSVLRHQGLVVTPNQNLASHIGSGADGGGASLWDYIEPSPIKEIIHPGAVQPDLDADMLMIRVRCLPEGQSLESLLGEGRRRVENGVARSNAELIRLARALHGDSPLLLRLEDLTPSADNEKN